MEEEDLEEGAAQKARRFLYFPFYVSWLDFIVDIPSFEIGANGVEGVRFPPKPQSLCFSNPQKFGNLSTYNQLHFGTWKREKYLARPID